jgi:hypothetical protein
MYKNEGLLLVFSARYLLCKSRLIPKINGVWPRPRRTRRRWEQERWPVSTCGRMWCSSRCLGVYFICPTLNCSFFQMVILQASKWMKSHHPLLKSGIRIWAWLIVSQKSDKRVKDNIIIAMSCDNFKVFPDFFIDIFLSTGRKYQRQNVRSRSHDWIVIPIFFLKHWISHRFCQLFIDIK